MSKRILKNYSGQIIGYIDTDSSGKETLKNYSGTILGYYKPNENITQNYSGTIIGYGNILTTLLSDPSVKPEEVGKPKDSNQNKPSDWKATSTYYENNNDMSDSHLIAGILKVAIPPLYGVLYCFKEIAKVVSPIITKCVSKINTPGKLFGVMLGVLVIALALSWVYPAVLTFGAAAVVGCLLWHKYATEQKVPEVSIKAASVPTQRIPLISKATKIFLIVVFLLVVVSVIGFIIWSKQ